MRVAAGVVILWSLLLPAIAPAQPEWLPGDVGEVMAQQIAEKIQAVDVEGKIAPGDGLVGARKGVGSIAARIQLLGETRMLEMAPVFAELELPSSGQKHLDAMSRYGLCSFPIETIYADTTNSIEQRITAAVMSTGVVIVSAFLRHQYRAAGGTDEQAKAVLAGPELSEIALTLQARDDLMQHVMSQCAGPMTELLK